MGYKVAVVGATGKVGRHPLPANGSAAGLYGSPHRATRPFGHGLTPGKTDLSLRSRGQRSCGHRFDVRGRVHQRQFTIAGCERFFQANLGQLIGQAVAQPGVLGHGKPVALRQRQYKVIGVEGLQGGKGEADQAVDGRLWRRAKTAGCAWF